VNGHSLKLHFCMFERSQRSIIIHFFIFFEYLSSIAKFTCSKLDTNHKCFCMSKTLKPQKWTFFVFFKHIFFYQMCTIPFENWRGFLTLMTKREKRLELMKIIFITHLSTFGSKVFLT